MSVPDWILQQTLEVQKSAGMAWVSGKKELDDGGLTLTALGCGTMGIAILGGIMDSLKSTSSSADSSSNETKPKRLPSKFIACVRSEGSARRITGELEKYDARLTISRNDNVQAVQAADIILLGCKPYAVKDVLQAEGIKEALAGKLLISILAGVPEQQIHDLLYKDDDVSSTAVQKCTIVRAMPNTAAAVRESMTVIEAKSPPLEPDTLALVTWMFNQVGKVAHLPATNMDAVTALCGSGPAFVALVIEGMAAGAIAMGVPRDEAYMMAAQAARGTTGLLLAAGEHPAIMKDKVTTPGGCTIGGLLVMEEAAVKGTMARAVREATVVASQLGQGKQGVNGTRH